MWSSGEFIYNFFGKCDIQTDGQNGHHIPRLVGCQIPPDKTPWVVNPLFAVVGQNPAGYLFLKIGTIVCTPDPMRPKRRGPDPLTAAQELACNAFCGNKRTLRRVFMVTSSFFETRLYI